MKKTTTMKQVFFLLFIAVLGACSGNNNRKLVGEWKGKDIKGKVNVLTFNKDNSVVWVADNRILGGESFEIEGTKGTLKYEVDYSKDPIGLDLVMQKSGEFNELARIKGIIRFISDTKMEYRLSFEGRFTEFDSRDKDNTLILEKVAN